MVKLSRQPGSLASDLSCRPPRASVELMLKVTRVRAIHGLLSSSVAILGIAATASTLGCTADIGSSLRGGGCSAARGVRRVRRRRVRRSGVARRCFCLEGAASPGRARLGATSPWSTGPASRAARLRSTRTGRRRRSSVRVGASPSSRRRSSPSRSSAPVSTPGPTAPRDRSSPRGREPTPQNPGLLDRLRRGSRLTRTRPACLC